MVGIQFGVAPQIGVQFKLTRNQIDALIRENEMRLLMSRIAVFVSLCLLSLTNCPRSFADETDAFIPSALKATNDIEWSQRTVRILDPDGNPLEGAVVKLWAMRAGSGHGYWSEESFGSGRQKDTAINGETVVNYPKTVNSKLTVTEISLAITHPQFCAKAVHLPVEGDIPKVTLEQGTKIRIAGVEPGSMVPLPDCHLMIENGETAESEFVREADGWLVSKPLKGNRRWYRVVRLSPNEPPQFGQPRAWSPNDPDSLTAFVPIQPGVKVVGRISENVARPIVRGQVVVWCGSPIRKEEGVDNDRASPIWWTDVAKIQEDGTFEFPSLPSGFLAQFYAYANDSISMQPSDEAYEKCCEWFTQQSQQRHLAFRYGQVVRLAGRTTKVAIEMEPGHQVTIRCVDSNGKPLAGIDVYTNPNQFIVGAGSNIFCTGFSTVDILRGKRDVFRRRSSIYHEKTNDDGLAVLRNMPEGNFSLGATSRSWQTDDNLQLKCKADQVNQQTITMRPSK